jgi:competence protein ComFC
MLHILFPKECLICSKIGLWLCKKCQKKLVQTLPTCYICKSLSNKYCTHNGCLDKNSLNKITTIWKYNEYGKSLIHSYKYKHRFQVGDFLFSLIEDKLKTFDMKDSVLIPLPSHKMKILERGFSPTESMCELISEKYKIPVEKEIIFKKQNNTNQASLNYTEREKNVLNIFETEKDRVKNLAKYKQAIIVDDIITTGSTLNEINKVLKECVPEDFNVNALCIFQGIFRKNESQKSLQSDR